jgi:hypothetical protein
MSPWAINPPENESLATETDTVHEPFFLLRWPPSFCH